MNDKMPDIDLLYDVHELIRVVQMVYEEYYGDGGDLQSVAQAARRILLKLQAIPPPTDEDGQPIAAIAHGGAGEGCNGR